MKNYQNLLIAAIVSTKRVGDWLIQRAMCTPYNHIHIPTKADTERRATFSKAAI